MTVAEEQRPGGCREKNPFLTFLDRGRPPCPFLKKSFLPLRGGRRSQGLMPDFQKNPHKREESGLFPGQVVVDDVRVVEDAGGSPDDGLGNQDRDEPN